MPPGLAEAFLRAQIEASKTYQRELWQGWEAFKRPAFADVPDLATVTRPKLDQLTAQMLRALAANAAALADPAGHAQVAQALRPMQAAEVSEKAVEQALAPLVK